MVRPQRATIFFKKCNQQWSESSKAAKIESTRFLVFCTKTIQYASYHNKTKSFLRWRSRSSYGRTVHPFDWSFRGIISKIVIYIYTRELPGIALVNILNREILMGNRNTFMYISYKHWMFLYIWNTCACSSVWIDMRPHFVWCSDPPVSTKMPFVILKFADETIHSIKAQNKDSHISK